MKNFQTPRERQDDLVADSAKIMAIADAKNRDLRRRCPARHEQTTAPAASRRWPPENDGERHTEAGRGGLLLGGHPVAPFTKRERPERPHESLTAAPCMGGLHNSPETGWHQGCEQTPGGGGLKPGVHVLCNRVASNTL